MREPTGPASSRRSRGRSEEHTSELQSQSNLVCRLLLEKTKNPSCPLGRLTPRPAAAATITLSPLWGGYARAAVNYRPDRPTSNLADTPRRSARDVALRA